MLCDIQKHLKVDGEVEHDFVRRCLCNGHYWAFAHEYPGVVTNEDFPLPPEYGVVCDILDAWWMIEVSYDRLNKKDKTDFDTAYGKSTPPKFTGFDGNNEGEYYSIAMFLISDLDRYEHFDGRDLNSHMHALSKNTEIAKRYKQKIKTIPTPRRFTKDELIALLK